MYINSYKNIVIIKRIFCIGNILCNFIRNYKSLTAGLDQWSENLYQLCFSPYGGEGVYGFDKEN